MEVFGYLGHNIGVGFMDLQGWANIAAILAAAIAIVAFMSRAVGKLDIKIDSKIDCLESKFDGKFAEVDAKFDRLETKLGSQIERTRIELREDLGRIDSRLDMIDQRVYELAQATPGPSSPRQAGPRVL